MLSPEQESWLSHLSDQDQVKIFPYDPSAQAKFAAVREKIRAVLGPQIQVEHRGATGLGISGQDEIDVYVPVAPDQFDALIAPLAAAFGAPRSHYPRERARFVTFEEGKRVDIFLINKTCQSWLDGCRFEAYLRQHPDALRQYEQLKAAGHGLSTREYYRRKIEFINEILASAI